MSPVEVISAVACYRSRGSGCSRPGYGISPLGEGCHLPYNRATRTYMGLGKQTLGGHKQNLVHIRTQKKRAVTPQETDPDWPGSAQESPVEVWVSGGLFQGWGTECGSICMGPSQGGCHDLHYLHHSLAYHSPTHQQKIELKIY